MSSVHHVPELYEYMKKERREWRKRNERHSKRPQISDIDSIN